MRKKAPSFYAIEAGPPPRRMARGWHCLGMTATFDDGAPHKIEAFGTTLVVFKTDSGEFAVLNNFCPHMGASLADGRVRGDSIACPFHDWRWGADGKCTAIPYSRRVPPGARTRSWETLVRNNLLFVWHDPEGYTAPDDVTIPEIPELNTHYSPWSHSVHRIETNTRELIDNMVDVSHFFYVHGHGISGGCSFFGNIFEGHKAWQFIEIGEQMGHGYDYLKPGAPLDQIGGSRSETCYYGPATLISRGMSRDGDDLIENYILLLQLPVTPDVFDLHMLINVRKRDDLTPAQNAARAQGISDWIRIATLEDVRIWETKTRIDNPLLCEGDGPFYQLRRWYSQFFVDDADVTPEMTERFEKITNTDFAMAQWAEQAKERIAELEAEGAGMPPRGMGA